MQPSSFPANQFLIGLRKAAWLFILVKFDSSRQVLKNHVVIGEKRALACCWGMLFDAFLKHQQIDLAVLLHPPRLQTGLCPRPPKDINTIRAD